MTEKNQHARDSAELRRLCSERDQLRSEALAGYAVRDARIAELEGEIDDLSHWRDLALQFDNHRMAALWHLKRLVADPQSKSCAALFLGEPPLSAHEVAAERDQLRAELAAAKETIERYETTAENCDLLRTELAAIKRQVPVAADVFQFLTAVMDAAGLVRHGRQSKELSDYLGKECARLRCSLASPATSAVVPAVPDGAVLVGRAELSLIRNALLLDCEQGRPVRGEMLTSLDSSVAKFDAMLAASPAAKGAKP